MLLYEKVKVIRHETVTYKMKSWCGFLKVAFLQIARESGDGCPGRKLEIIGNDICKSLIVLRIFVDCLFVTTTIVDVVIMIFYEISLEVFTGHTLILADGFEGCVPSRLGGEVDCGV